MTSNEFKTGLAEYYQGEVIGEVLFDRLLAEFPDPVQRYKIATMLQLETETKARLRPAMLEFGVSLEEEEQSRETGREFAAALGGGSWSDFVNRLGEGVKPYVERYRRLLEVAPPEYRELAESMVVHEESLLRFAELESTGQSDRSIDDVVAQLKFPLTPPG